MQKEKMNKNNKGITIIALVITIIIMLILVGVSVTVALNGGLFRTAEKAADGTEDARDIELARAEGEVEVGGLVYNSAQDYIDKKPKLPNNANALDKETVEGNTATANWDLAKVTAVEITEEDGTKNIIPLPKEYQISLKDGENTIDEGLVITDGENEFVWIPLDPLNKGTVFTKRYISYVNIYEEPIRVGQETQPNLDYYYGNNYYTLENNFDYETHYNEMVTSINKYGGFYIGRYETTIDEEGKVGSKVNTKILKGNIKLPNSDKSCRWWGLYDSQRNSNVKGNKDYVQTSMIWGQQWSALIPFLGNSLSNSTIQQKLANAVEVKSGQAVYDENGLKDEMKNIFDLRGNVSEWTAESVVSNDSSGKLLRGRNN